jgi:hypothetical protein
MKASTIVTIVLRIFAIYWFVTGLVGFVGVVFFRSAIRMLSDHGFAHLSQLLVMPLSYMILAAVFWMFADGVAKYVVPDEDPEVGVLNVLPQDLYGLGILVVGLLSCLSHLGPLLGWVHYLVVNQAGEALMQGKTGVSMYDMTNELIPCVAGGVLALASPRLAARLVRLKGLKGDSSEVIEDGPSAK